MFGLGMWEVAVLLLVALLVLGPEKLPKVARKLGRGLREVRRAASELQSNLAEADRDVRSYTSDMDPSRTPKAEPAPKSIEAETANAAPGTEPPAESESESKTEPETKPETEHEHEHEHEASEPETAAVRNDPEKPSEKT